MYHITSNNIRLSLWLPISPRAICERIGNVNGRRVTFAEIFNLRRNGKASGVQVR
ncbi:hypothetical protein [Teichococcus rhizosphaerae]|uniref:hypothetical protein n=1 Tax=Teichococcus rhizosphaerae TaxID=1335062 RepID=UPI00159BE26A|nr:hypothetical protein [Pseudoroseomonas rhizosphaerae]